MITTPELKQVPETTKDTEHSVDLKNATNEHLKTVADGIVNNPENQEQVKLFPDKWNSLSLEEKTKLASELTSEVKNSIKELSDLWVEYSPEITQEDVDNVAALEFVRANKEKIPQSWVKLEEKANEVAKNIGVEVQDKWILDTQKL